MKQDYALRAFNIQKSTDTTVTVSFVSVKCMKYRVMPFLLVNTTFKIPKRPLRGLRFITWSAFYIWALMSKDQPIVLSFSIIKGVLYWQFQTEQHGRFSN